MVPRLPLAALLALASAACGPAPERLALPAAEPPPPPAASAEAQPTATASAPADAAPSPPPTPPLPPVELVQIDSAPAPEKMPALSILAPAKGQLVPSAKAKTLAVKLRAAGWPLERGGNHLCVVLDRHPCHKVEDLGAPLALGDLDPTLDDGLHVISVFARRASGESVKPAGKRAAFASVSFFVGKRTPVAGKQSGAPMLFLSFPDEGPAPPEGLLVDAYVANADFGTGRFRIHSSVGGPGLDAGRAESVDSLKPWRLRNARPGEYLVQFSVFRYEPVGLQSASAVEVSYESKPVPGAFGEETRSFRVTAK